VDSMEIRGMDNKIIKPISLEFNNNNNKIISKYTLCKDNKIMGNLNRDKAIHNKDKVNNSKITLSYYRDNHNKVNKCSHNKDNICNNNKKINTGNNDKFIRVNLKKDLKLNLIFEYKIKFLL